MSSLRFLLPN